MKRARPIGVLAALALLSACTVGPDYQKPSAPVAAQYKEAGWKVGEPLDAIDRGAGWSIYKEPVLDGLERQIDISNQNLKAAAAAFQQAEWIVAQARAGFFPTGNLNTTAQRIDANIVVSRGSVGLFYRQALLEASHSGAVQG